MIWSDDGRLGHIALHTDTLPLPPKGNCFHMINLLVAEAVFDEACGQDTGLQYSSYVRGNVEVFS
jgi:hypothetical protein